MPHAFTNLAFNICLFPETRWACWQHLRVHQFTGAPCGSPQPSLAPRSPRFIAHFLLQEVNRRMAAAGQAALPARLRQHCEEHASPLYLIVMPMQRENEIESITNNSARQGLRSVLGMVLKCLQTSKEHL